MKCPWCGAPYTEDANGCIKHHCTCATETHLGVCLACGCERELTWLGLCYACDDDEVAVD